VFDVDEKATHVDVLPLGIGTHRARAPDAIAATFEEAQGVDAFRIKHILTALVDVGFEASQSAHDFVRWRLVHAPFNVRARVNSSDEP